MSTRAGSRLHPSLRTFPGVVLELSPDGTVTDSNGRLESALSLDLVGLPLSRALDRASRQKLERLLAGEAGEAGATWELVFEVPEAVVPVRLAASRAEEEGRARVWLVEFAGSGRAVRLDEELHRANSELVNTQRELAKEKARLVRALDELERELHANEHLSQELQAQNEEMEAQNEELLAMTEELHSGQDQLLRLNHQLERRTRELQVAISARNRFYAAMSHELRTPINAIMGYNDLLLASVYGRLAEQQELAIERSQRAAQHLKELVNDILDLSRIELGKVDLQAEALDLPSLVEDLFVVVRPLAEGRGSTLHLVDGDAPCTVVTDPRRVRQIVLNLLSNAIKFGNGQPVMVRCGRASDGGAVLEVVDGGDGIPPEDLTRIFEEFVQLGTDVIGGSPEGTGLGLPISRRLAHILGGRLEVSSTVGVGSTFHLTLPPSIAPAPGVL